VGNEAFFLTEDDNVVELKLIWLDRNEMNNIIWFDKRKHTSSISRKRDGFSFPV